MCKAGLAFVTVLACTGWGCGATTRDGSSNARLTSPPVTLTSASATFMTRDEGKDDDSAITVQILDDSSRLAAEATSTDKKFDDKTVSPALSLTVMRAMPSSDLSDARVRLRLTPDGEDSWNFDMRLILGLADGTQRTYFWSGLHLDEKSPERVLTLASGRLP
jgi:hypothetical protein